MRSLALPLAVCLLLPGHELTTDYGRARTLRVSSELELDLETTKMEMTVDDKPVEDPGRGGSSSSLVRRCVVADQILEGAAGRPKHLKRTFETLHDALTFSFGEDERSDEREYPLQGVTLELTRDDEGKVTSELVDGPKPDDAALLEEHELALALDAFLPEDAVEKDAKWELDAAACKRALASAIDPKLFAETPPDEGARGGGGGERGERGGRRGSGRGGAGRTLGLVEWTGKAQLVALDAEHDGVACAKIALELEGSGTIPEPTFRGPPRGYLFAPELLPAREGTVEGTLKGELYVSLEQRRPVYLKLDGELRTDNRFERERDGQHMVMHSQQSGRLTLTVQVEE